MRDTWQPYTGRSQGTSNTTLQDCVHSSSPAPHPSTDDATSTRISFSSGGAKSLKDRHAFIAYTTPTLDSKGVHSPAPGCRVAPLLCQLGHLARVAILA